MLYFSPWFLRCIHITEHSFSFYSLFCLSNTINFLNILWSLRNYPHQGSNEVVGGRSCSPGKKPASTHWLAVTQLFKQDFTQKFNFGSTYWWQYSHPEWSPQKSLIIYSLLQVTVNSLRSCESSVSLWLIRKCCFEVRTHDQTQCVFQHLPPSLICVPTIPTLQSLH